MLTAPLPLALTPIIPRNHPPTNVTDPGLPSLPQKLRDKIIKHGAVLSAGSNSRLSTNPHSSFSTDPLECCLTFLQSQAIANSTRHTYSASIRRYTTFCTSKQWQSFPATESTLCYFAAYLADQVSHKTIKLCMAGIHFAHIENGLTDPFQDAPSLHLLHGIK